MNYSRFFKAYHAVIRIKKGQLFKFVVDGIYRTSKDYQTIFVTIDLTIGQFRKCQQRIHPKL